MFGLTVISTKHYPFYREIKRLINEKPEYKKKIAEGYVHLACDPGHGFEKTEEAKGE